MKAARHACRHCGTIIEFTNIDEPVDCPTCKHPWFVNAAGVLVKLYRPPKRQRRGGWFRR